MKSYSFLQTYRGPGIVGVIVLAGLLIALLSDGVWDVVASLLLAAPLLLLARFLSRAGSKAGTAKHSHDV
jgi:hypothetical protein